ncbi:MCD, Malonyl-CoA decarboxylase MCD [Siccirubricoccus deserti]|uniref:Malonyl-CoA decarboxylase n=1 Tax=Siccirubricoccus deserti TaxID=2013562 RepID=A0A9X0UE96_9PROT|nr:malonyl-CoA decarboxylase [Siccirubricoccus deserti]MBC4017529.1 malonyl-CoA decarboxylase [Siccirubricoccus deserti]GGC59670.1 MCD, Malonyl-CoA decarboxylase MCD [Siccirubricoccus deserti]
MASIAPGLVDPRGWLERIWSSVADRGRAYADVPAASLPPLDRARRLAETLLSERGEASGAAVARALQDTLASLGAEERLGFYRFIAEGFTPDVERLRAAAEAWLASPDAATAARLADAAEPPRQELLRRMNHCPGGTAALVGMRKELLGLLRAQCDLRPLDADLRHLFASWFNRGFLELRRIDWQTPAAVLEKLIDYEAVHEIQGWDDLRRRLAADRRCFAFFHPALPGEPLIFVEVALVEGMAAAVQPLLSRDSRNGGRGGDAARADTAIFYSISNCQEGLRGISFGNFLIKQVVEELKAELPQLTRFATLSPVPGFRRWLERCLAAPPEEGAFLPEEAAALTAAAGVAEPVEAFQALTAEGWPDDPAREAALRPVLLRLAAAYLTRPNAGMGGIDPVARFHLGNGAQLERVNWLGNRAARGLQESYGIMVNYLYDREAIEANHEAFIRSGQVARSPAVEVLLTPPRPAPAGRFALGRLLGGEERGAAKAG